MQTPDELVAHLLKESSIGNNSETKILLQQLYDAANVPGDMQCFIGPVIKLLPCHNIEIKKTAYLVLPRICAFHPDTALLAVNTIIKDCKDPNPAVKCLAVSVLCSLPQLLEHTSSVLKLTFEDSNPKVRHAAVMGCGEIFKRCPTHFKDLCFIDRLYECIRDNDPLVVTSSLLILDMVLASEGGVVVNRNMRTYLLKRLCDFSDVQLATVLQVLGKYTPTSEEELFHELSILDPYLAHSSGAVVVSSIQLFLHRIEDNYSYLAPDVIRQSVPTLEEFLRPPSAKNDVNVVLDFLATMIHKKKFEWLLAFGDSFCVFLPSEKDDPKIVANKFFLLPFVCNEDNSSQILHELEQYCVNFKTSKEAILCVSTIARHHLSDTGHKCLCIFIKLLEFKNEQVCNNVLTVLQDIDLQLYDSQVVSTLLQTVFCNKCIIDNAHHTPLVALLLGEFGSLIQDQSPYILENLINKFDSFEDKTKELVLTMSVKMFLKMPAKCQHLLGEIFEKCMCESVCADNPYCEIQQKARIYYHMLQEDINLLKRILVKC